MNSYKQTKQVLDIAMTDLQRTKQSLCELCNIEKDRDILNACHKSIDKIDGAINKLSELF